MSGIVNIRKLVRPIRGYLRRRATRLQILIGRLRMRLKGGFTTAEGVARYHTAKEGNDELRRRILSGEPFMAARFGLFELQAIAETRYFARPKSGTLQYLCNNAGFFPEDKSLLARFCDVYEAAGRHIDVFCAWLFRHGMWASEHRAYSELCPRAYLTDIRVMDSFLYEPPWTSALEGRKVLVVHPFAKTIRAQYERRAKLFRRPDVLPQFGSLEVIGAVQSSGGARPSYATWFDALKFMEGEVAQHDFDVALIGAGAYGFPLAGFVKSLGRQGIHMGGVTQLLFGIIGKRWESWYPWLFNDYWVRPSESETPPEASRIEGGCYW